MENVIELNGKKYKIVEIEPEKVEEKQDGNILFVTEDNYAVTNFDKVVYYVDIRDYDYGGCHLNGAFYVENKSFLKTFIYRENALEYIKMNKPIGISLKTLLPIIGECNNNTHIDLEKLTSKLKELVK